jgi:hypothetical protein
MRSGADKIGRGRTGTQRLTDNRAWCPWGVEAGTLAKPRGAWVRVQAPMITDMVVVVKISEKIIDKGIAKGAEGLSAMGQMDMKLRRATRTR